MNRRLRSINLFLIRWAFGMIFGTYSCFMIQIALHHGQITTTHDLFSFAGSTPRQTSLSQVYKSTIENKLDEDRRRISSSRQLHQGLQQPSVPIVRNNNESPRRKLQTILDETWLESKTNHNNHNNNTLHEDIDHQPLWEKSELLPTWMKEYFVWHQKQLQVANASNWRKHRWLVMQCIDTMDDSCGGTADRLKPFLLLLREAYEMNRILLIHWNQPMELEEFLIPPHGGLDWRVPSWFLPMIYDPTVGKVCRKIPMLRSNGQGMQAPAVLRSRYQSVTGGEDMYNERILKQREKQQLANNGAEPLFRDVYHDVWRIFFRPSLPVATIIQEEMEKMRLRPGNYVAAHLRALYGRSNGRSDQETIDWTQNALNCASTLYPGAPIYFASDYTYATQVAIDYNRIVQQQYHSNSRIESRIHDHAPLHLEKMDMVNPNSFFEKKTTPKNKTMKSQRILKPNELYDTFVDLYLMGMSSCVTYNRGGFGQWALLIGYNATCEQKQKTSALGIGFRCNWTEPASKESLSSTTLREDLRPPLFLEPMTNDDYNQFKT